MKKTIILIKLCKKKKVDSFESKKSDKCVLNG